MTFRAVFIKVAKSKGWDDARIQRSMKAASLNMPAPPDMELTAEAAAIVEQRMSQLHDWAAQAAQEELKEQIDKLATPHVAKN